MRLYRHPAETWILQRVFAGDVWLWSGGRRHVLAANFLRVTYRDESGRVTSILRRSFLAWVKRVAAHKCQTGIIHAKGGGYRHMAEPCGRCGRSLTLHRNVQAVYQISGPMTFNLRLVKA